MPVGARLAVFLLTLLLLVAGPGAAAEPVRARQGVLDATAAGAQPFALDGEWGFAWQRFVEPDWRAMPAKQFTKVPSSWNEVTLDGKPRGPSGWGTYLLQVDCAAGQSLAVEAFGERSAGRLYINGELVAQHGQPGPSAQESHAAVYQRIPITREYACPLRLTMHLSNYDHRAGGFVRPLFAGPADALARQREARIVYSSLLLAAYLLTGLVGLIFFAVRRRERTPLVYALFCLAMAVYTDAITERLFLRLLPDQMSWAAFMRVEYLSWVAAMGLFLLTLRDLFPQELDRRPVLVVEGILVLAAFAVMVLPPAVYSHVAQPGQLAAVLVGGYVARGLMLARKRTNIDASVLLVGLLAVIVSQGIDFVLIDTPGPDRKFAPIGFALFLLSPAVVIGRRLTRALNAEERGRTLEENARLREDVERMSRHDLKTPLNSILGATRLLRDDPVLTSDQRELVGVLQRAGLRMLEMVNLSLGLYRMETGTYHFQPQPVDLREVATRVLVDLEAYADDNGVTLHHVGSNRSEVLARGEETLCYSIVANLVKNAIEASGRGQRVEVEVERVLDHALLSVRNPGEVPPDIARRFFDKYVTSGKSGGTGLGTYSARLMALAQQGDLKLRTGPAGTTVTLTLKPLVGDLPLAQPAVPMERPASYWVHDLPPRDVLVADDDEFNRLVTRRMLPHPPFTVESVANGQAAIEAMARRWPHYVVIDMEMPVKDGVEAVRWLRAEEAAAGRPRCGVIMLSGNDDEASRARALEAGVDRYFAKPVARDVLLAALRELEGVPMTQPAPLEQPYSPAAASASRAPTGDDELLRVDPEWLDVFPNFVTYQRETLQSMAAALAAGDRERMRFLAHRACGGLGTMGLAWASDECRRLEDDAPHGDAPDLQRRIARLREHLERVRVAST